MEFLIGDGHAPPYVWPVAINPWQLSGPGGQGGGGQGESQTRTEETAPTHTVPLKIVSFMSTIPAIIAQLLLTAAEHGSTLTTALG